MQDKNNTPKTKINHRLLETVMAYPPVFLSALLFAVYNLTCCIVLIVLIDLNHKIPFNFLTILFFCTGIPIYGFLRKKAGITNRLTYFLLFGFSYLGIYVNAYYLFALYISNTVSKMTEAIYNRIILISLAMDMFVIFVEDFLIAETAIEIVVLIRQVVKRMHQTKDERKTKCKISLNHPTIFLYTKNAFQKISHTVGTKLLAKKSTQNIDGG